MTFTSKYDLFANNKKMKKKGHKSLNKSDNKEKNYLMKRLSTQNSKNNDDEVASNTQSIFTLGEK